MGILFTNNATSTLTSAITSGATTVVIQTADAAKFPQPSLANDYFMMTIEDRTQNPALREIVKCTARTSNSITVVRAQENTTAVGFNAGAMASHRLTAGSIQTLMQGTSAPVALYLGSFASAPSSGVGGAVLVLGNLYYNTTSHQLFAYNGVSWQAVSPGGGSTSFGIYLGAFGSPPITMLDGSALVLGTLYYNTGGPDLYEWNGTAWVSVTGTTSNTSITNQTVGGNLTVGGNETIQGDLTVNGNGHFSSLSVDNDTATTTLHLDGALVVDAGDISGQVDWQRLPNGNIFMWGTGNTDSSGTALVSLPTTLPNGNLKTVLPTATSQDWQARVTARGPTGFTVKTFSRLNNSQDGGPIAFDWWAVGD